MHVPSPRCRWCAMGVTHLFHWEADHGMEEERVWIGTTERARPPAWLRMTSAGCSFIFPAVWPLFDALASAAAYILCMNVSE